VCIGVKNLGFDVHAPSKVLWTVGSETRERGRCTLQKGGSGGNDQKLSLLALRADAGRVHAAERGQTQTPRWYDRARRFRRVGRVQNVIGGRKCGRGTGPWSLYPFGSVTGRDIVVRRTPVASAQRRAVDLTDRVLADRPITSKE